MDSVNAAVIKKIEKRQLNGAIKYGQTMDRGDLTKIQWLTHAQEEALDLAVYLEKLIQLETGTEAKPEPEKQYEPLVTGKNVMPFGKYGGRLLEDIPSAYLKWFLENVSGNEGIKAYIEERLIAEQ